MAKREEAYSKAMEAGTQVSLETLERPPFLDILREIAEKLPSDKVMITELRVLSSRGNEQTLNIQGEVLDATGFNAAFENLKQSKLIHVDEEPTRAQKENKTTFSITATI